MPRSATRWLPLFKDYLKHARIQSKHEYNPDGKGMQLSWDKLLASQRMVLEQILEGLSEDIHTFVILKSRQLGVTTLTLLIDIFWCALHPGIIGIIASDTEENSNKNRKTIEYYVESLAPYLGKSFYIENSNKQFILFSNGSRLDLRYAGKTKKAWAEGEGYALAHLTEVSKFGKPEGLTSFRETLSETNEIRLYIYESTAWGDNHWKEMWEDAVADTFTKRAIFVGWWSHDKQRIPAKDPRFAQFGTQPPTREEHEKARIILSRYGMQVTQEQIAWWRWRSSQKSEGAFDLDQNQPWLPEDAFVLSGISFFQTRRIALDINKIDSAPLMTDDGEPATVDKGGFAYQGFMFEAGHDFHLAGIEPAPSKEQIVLRIWEQPVKTGQYVIGCDPAFGRNDNKDNHAIEVYRCFADKLVQVAEYADHNVETRQCAWMLAYLAGRYKNCMINIDLAGGPGQVVKVEFQHLRDRMRSDMYSEVAKGFTDEFKDEDFLAAANWHIYRRPDSPGAGFMFDTKTSHDIKFRMMNMMRDSYASELLLIRSRHLLDEMANVVQEGPDIGARATGNGKDDRTFATALANMTWTENIRPSLVAQGIIYSNQMAIEAGRESPVAAVLNRSVARLFQMMGEAADMPPPRTFYEERGLA